jgi:pyruvate carboxylase
MSCSKDRDSIARVCRAIEELLLQNITANITYIIGCLMHTIFIEIRRQTSCNTSICIVWEVHIALLFVLIFSK